MTDFVGRLIVYGQEMRLEPFTRDPVLGDTIDVIRGSGAREGERMGTATVTGFYDGGEPIVEIHFGGSGQESATAA